MKNKQFYLALFLFITALCGSSAEASSLQLTEEQRGEFSRHYKRHLKDNKIITHATEDLTNCTLMACKKLFEGEMAFLRGKCESFKLEFPVSEEIKKEASFHLIFDTVQEISALIMFLSAEEGTLNRFCELFNLNKLDAGIIESLKSIEKRLLPKNSCPRNGNKEVIL